MIRRTAITGALLVGMTTLGMASNTNAKLRGGNAASPEHAAFNAGNDEGARKASPAIEAFQGLVASKAPWGIYDAALWSPTQNVLPEATGNGRDVTSDGTIISGKENGHGADGEVTFLSGRTSSRLLWPEGSIAGQYSICSITRYTGGSRGRILQAKRHNWLHGHWGERVGVVHYGHWLTSHERPYNTDWAVVCGTNGGSAPGNVLWNGESIGTNAGGPGGDILAINPADGNHPEHSDWAFSYVVIWDQQLSPSDMLTASNFLMNYLATGESTSSKKDSAGGSGYYAYSFTPQTVSTVSQPDTYTSIVNFPLVHAKLGDIFRLTVGIYTTHPGGRAVPCKALIKLGGTDITDRLLQTPVTKSTKDTSFVEIQSTITVLNSTSQIIKMNSKRFTPSSSNDTDYLGLQQGALFTAEDLWEGDPKFFDISLNVDSDGALSTPATLVRMYYYVERLHLKNDE